MKALSLWQPHASAIECGLKLYETRPWSTNYRGPLVIHAAKKLFHHKDYEPEYFREVAHRMHDANYPLFALPYGEALCIVDLVDCVPTARVRGRLGRAEFWGDFRDIGDDGQPRYAFKLENVRRLWPRLKVPGRQRFFEIHSALLKLEK